jgi:hypothetical protein
MFPRCSLLVYLWVTPLLVTALAPFHTQSCGRLRATTSTHLCSHPNNNDNNDNNDNNSINNNNSNNKNSKPDWMHDVQNTMAALGIAASILVGSGSVGGPVLSVANALELSTGAFVIETSTKRETLANARIDSGSLITTLFKNRQALTSSLGRIQKTIGEELSSPAWTAVQKAVLQFEGDVAPELKFIAPADLKQTVLDLRQGKLNFVLNGEVVNVVVEPQFSDQEDDITIRILGFKGVDFTQEPTVVARGYISQQLNGIYEFWVSPVPEPYSKFLPAGTDIGTTILGGSVAGITAIYAGSYAYYTAEIAKEQQAAEDKRLTMAAKKEAADRKAKAVKKPTTEDGSEPAAKPPKAKKEIKESTAVTPEAKETSPAATDEASNSKGSKEDTPKKEGKSFKFWKKN